MSNGIKHTLYYLFPSGKILVGVTEAGILLLQYIGPKQKQVWKFEL
jgi:hypothetical protein